MRIESGTYRAELVCRALERLIQSNARLLNDPEEDLSEAYRQEVIEEQKIMEEVIVSLRGGG